MVKVSAPSVVASAVTLNTLDSCEPTMKSPVNAPPPMSALCIPVMVYGKLVPLATLVVVRVIVNAPPSLTLDEVVDNA